jgi:hypothetical protein
MSTSKLIVADGSTLTTEVEMPQRSGPRLAQAV